MEFKRRDFLQAAGGWLSAFTISELFLSQSRYSAFAATAATAPQKRALLIGINHYGPGETLPPLQGCLTDIELQRHLLHDRLGWDSSNIQVLGNQAATQAAIQTAIESFLLPSLGSGDVLLIHFSGYGRQVTGLGPTLIPYDVQADGSHDLPLRYLAGLRLPPGVKLWCCLDAGLRLTGELNSRERHRPALGENNNLNPITPGPGITWLYPTVAQEILVAGTPAGAFSQTLTQHLWANGLTNPLSGFGVAQTLEGLSGELIHLHWQAESGTRIPGTLILNPTQLSATQGVDAVVLGEPDSRSGQIWLGGIPRHLLNQAGWQSHFQVISPEPASPPVALTLQNPTGLLVTSPVGLTPGTLLQERQRLLPLHLPLTIGLGDELDKVTRIDAVSALDSFNELVNVTTEAAGDFNLIAQSEAGSCLYGLAWPGGTVVPHTLGQPGEAIKGAIRRLGTGLPVLVAHKILSLLQNGSTSGLGVSVAWERLSPQPELLLRIATERADWPLSATSEPPLGNFANPAWEQGVTFQVGEQFRYRVSNFSPDVVYGLWLAWDSAAGLLILPTRMDTAQPAWQLTLAPQFQTSLPVRDLRYASPAVNSYLLFSRTPFQQTLDYLHRFTITGDPPLHVPDQKSLPLLQAILHDLDQDQANPNPHHYRLDLQAWAGFCFTFRIV